MCYTDEPMWGPKGARPPTPPQGLKEKKFSRLNFPKKEKRKKKKKRLGAPLVFSLGPLPKNHEFLAH